MVADERLIDRVQTGGLLFKNSKELHEKESTVLYEGSSKLSHNILLSRRSVSTESVPFPRKRKSCDDQEEGFTGIVCPARTRSIHPDLRTASMRVLNSSSLRGAKVARMSSKGFAIISAARRA